MTTDTPEYKTICSCRVELTEKLSNCFKDVAEYLSQSGALTGKQCRTIISAEMLLNYVLVDIKDPDTTLDAFAYFVTAMKQSGNTFFKAFVKKKIEAKRKEFYRELLQVPPGFQVSQEYDVFISYSHEDDTMCTVDTLLRPRLEQEGFSVFVDRNGIRPGDRWRSEIASAIKTCKAFVVVLTKCYVRSVYCNGELYEAVALKKQLFPVVCEDGWRDVPGGAPVMEVVRDFQDVSLVAEDRETQFKRLVQWIKETVAPLSPVAVAPGSSNLPTDRAGPSSPVMEGVCKETGVSDQQLDQEISESDIILLAEKFPHLLSVHKALTIYDLQHVYEKLKYASPHWFNLGLALGLTHPVLTNMYSEHRGNNVLCLREMLAKLLSTQDVTWSLLSDGLKKPTVELINLADSITATTPNLLNQLDLTPANLDDVTDVTRRYGNQAGVAHALRMWRRVNPSRATFRALVEVAIGLRRGDTATDICRFIVKELNKDI